MTIDDLYAQHRAWAVTVVRSWAHAIDPFSADDIVQDVFMSMYRSRFRDSGDLSRGFLLNALKWGWRDHLKSRTRMHRDCRITDSIDLAQEINDDWDVACPQADTEASALARVELSEKFARLSPYQRRVMLTNALTPEGGKGIPRSTITSIQRRLRGKAA